jgi:hypothetical protein
VLFSVPSSDFRELCLGEVPRTPFSRTSENAAPRHLGEPYSTVGHPPKPGHIAQTVNARGFAYSTCCTLQPLLARRCRGRSFGIVYCLRTADKALDTNIVGFSFLRVLQQKRRADERLEPLTCSLRVIGQALQGIAQGCKSRITRLVSFLCCAECCTVLRSRWCQSGVRSSSITSSGSDANHIDGQKIIGSLDVHSGARARRMGRLFALWSPDEPRTS